MKKSLVLAALAAVTVAGLAGSADARGLYRQMIHPNSNVTHSLNNAINGGGGGSIQAGSNVTHSLNNAINGPGMIHPSKQVRDAINDAVLGNGHGGGHGHGHGHHGHGGVSLSFDLSSGVSAWDAHVQWCLNRYRTYNPETNMYMSNKGPRFCDSPYV